MAGHGLKFAPQRVCFEDESAETQLTYALSTAFGYALNREVVIVCVGTDRSTGDAFGPIIGSHLQDISPIPVYGTLENPVHAVNLTTTLDTIARQHHGNPFILAIDACLGRFDHVGQLIVEQGPLRPGAGVQKALPAFGDFTLTGVVNVSGFMEYFVLQNTRLSVVMQMSNVVVRSLQTSLHRLRTMNEIARAVH
ncbi:spore protease YyaC [Alicyclobacillaceae bacterium I2511]|nr:spore protease YyaC [Alicyclobacillaceae bacterium I2511]